MCEAAADGGARNRIRRGLGNQGIERLEARLFGQAYAPHRHDRYAIGITLLGIQTFHYRGERRHCLPGQCHILHPDERHDGAAGDSRGFAYRIAYIDPALIQAALGGATLPFVAEPVVMLPILQDGPAPALWAMEEPVDELATAECAAAVADMLVRAARGGRGAPGTLALSGLQRVRDMISAEPDRPVSAAKLERIAGLDRYTLARQFRAAFGTSPSRFRTMRQLDRAQAMIGAGLRLAEAAAGAGFADQSHMTRQFKHAYGVTPKRWAARLKEGDIIA